MTKQSVACTVCMTVLLSGLTVSPAQAPPPNQPDMLVNAKARAEVIDSLAQRLREQYVFPEVADRLAQMLTERLAHGEYASVSSATEFGNLLTQQMRDIAHDAHLQVSYAYVLPPLPKTPSQPAQQPAPNRSMLLVMKEGNYGFQEANILNGNVGYLKVNAFTDAENGGETAAAAMEFLANTDALVVDLRQNMGGRPEMVNLLASYFFPGNEPVHLNDISLRAPGSNEHTLQQWWSLPYVPGKRYLDKNIYILTSHQTPSAAEEFAYDLKVLKRATVVGERTWGGANPGRPVRLTDHFFAFIPFGQAINPVTKTSWEGSGVEPDISVAEADALKTAHMAALHHLIEKTSDPQRLTSLKEALSKVGGDPETKSHSSRD